MSDWLKLSCCLLACSICAVNVQATVERAIFTTRELDRRVREKLYILGYCDSPTQKDCKQLTQLLEQSEAQLRGGFINHAVLLFDPSYWQTRLNTTSPTHLWFACHDGNGVTLHSLSFTNHTSSSTGDHSQQQQQDSSSGYAFGPEKHSRHVRREQRQQRRAHRQEQKQQQKAPKHPRVQQHCTFLHGEQRCSGAGVAVEGCGSDASAPWYACPSTSLESRLDLLLSSLVLAVEQHGQQCMSAYMRSTFPPAATAPLPPPPTAAGHQFNHTNSPEAEEGTRASSSSSTKPAACPAGSSSSSNSYHESVNSSILPWRVVWKFFAVTVALVVVIALVLVLRIELVSWLIGWGKEGNCSQPAAAATAAPLPAAAAAAAITTNNSSSSSGRYAGAAEIDNSYAAAAAAEARATDAVIAASVACRSAPLECTVGSSSQEVPSVAGGASSSAAAAAAAAPLCVEVCCEDNPADVRVITAYPHERVEAFKCRVAAEFGLHLDDVEAWELVDPASRQQVHLPAAAAAAQPEAAAAAGRGDHAAGLTAAAAPASGSSSAVDALIDTSQEHEQAENAEAEQTEDTEAREVVKLADISSSACAAPTLTAPAADTVAVSNAAAAAAAGGSVVPILVVDQLREDTAQLSSLVCSFHSEACSIKAAAAAASAALERQDSSTREALSCLQAQLDTLEYRLEQVALQQHQQRQHQAGGGDSAAAAAAAQGLLVQLADLLVRQGGATNSLLEELLGLTAAARGWQLQDAAAAGAGGGADHMMRCSNSLSDLLRHAELATAHSNRTTEAGTSTAAAAEADSDSNLGQGDDGDLHALSAAELLLSAQLQSARTATAAIAALADTVRSTNSSSSSTPTHRAATTAVQIAAGEHIDQQTCDGSNSSSATVASHPAAAAAMAATGDMGGMEAHQDAPPVHCQGSSCDGDALNPKCSRERPAAGTVEGLESTQLAQSSGSEPATETAAAAAGALDNYNRPFAAAVAVGTCQDGVSLSSSSSAGSLEGLEDVAETAAAVAAASTFDHQDIRPTAAVAAAAAAGVPLSSVPCSALLHSTAADLPEAASSSSSSPRSVTDSLHMLLAAAAAETAAASPPASAGTGPTSDMLGSDDWQQVEEHDL